LLKFARDFILWIIGSHPHKVINIQENRAYACHSVDVPWDSFAEKGLSKRVTERVAIFSDKVVRVSGKRLFNLINNFQYLPPVLRRFAQEDSLLEVRRVRFGCDLDDSSVGAIVTCEGIFVEADMEAGVVESQTDY